MNGADLTEPDDPDDMKLHHFLYRPVRITAGTFALYCCEHSAHTNCAMLVGREFDPDTGDDDGVYYHASAAHIKRNIVSGATNWELAPKDATLSKVHGEDGTGRHPDVQTRINKLTHDQDQDHE